LGSELIAGIVFEPGDWTVEPLGTTSHAGVAAHEAALEANDAGERSER
jgi:hypothetical protein